MNFVFFDAAAARDQFEQTTYVSAHVADIRHRKAILQISANELIFARDL